MEFEAKRSFLVKWARANPGRAIQSLIWILLQLILGAALGGMIVFGPLNQGGSPLTAVGAVFTGLIFAAATLRQKLLAAFGPESAARRWRMWVNRGSGVLAAVILVMTLTQLYLVGIIPAPFLSRTAEFNRIWRAVYIHYPYFEQKEINWLEIRERYAPQVADAKDDRAYFALIREMLAEMNDGHTQLLLPRPEERFWLGFAREIEDRAVVTWVREDIHFPGLERGAVVLSRDGLPVDEYLETLDLWHRSGSTERQRRQNALGMLLTAAEGEAFTLEYMNAEGDCYEVILTGGPLAEGSVRDSGSGAPLITGKRLDSGIALIEIPTFGTGSGVDLVAEFDAALENLFDAPGLIIDLRLNGGGSTLISDKIAGRLIAEPFVYGKELYTIPIPLRGWAREFVYRIKPRGETYTGPVVLLTDVFVMSTTENFVVALKDSGRAVLVGRPTAGSSGNPLPISLRGGAARFSTGDFRRNNGIPIEGVGLAPHIPVEWTLSDMIEQNDPDLAAAENYLLSLTQ